MHYYIDGYNLLFRILRAGDDLRTQREELVADMGKKVNLLGLDATLVFDSHYQKDPGTKSHLHNMGIIFTDEGESADEYILQELKESHKPSRHIVVTSDKKLARLCQMRLAKTESVDEFLGLINKRYKNKLRQKREQAKELLTLPVPPAAKQPAPMPAPTSTDSAQNCFDFYLDTFEKVVKEQEKHVPPKKAPQEPKKPKIKKRILTKEETELSDKQRWQNAFEKKRFRRFEFALEPVQYL